MAGAEAFGGAEQVYLSIRTRSGPNVTPELFTVDGERLLCMTSVATLKSKLLRKDPVVGLAARIGETAVVATGRVEVQDVASPVGVARFVQDNLAEMAGAAVDAVTGRLGRPLPPRRVALVVTIDEVRTTDVPGDAVAGWTRPDGHPLALPATWDPNTEIATLPAEVFRASGAADESAACVTLDSWTNYGPTGKQGVMLRGRGRAEIDGDEARLRYTLERMTSWDGVRTGTEPLPR
jgi:hypothetical protein